MKIRRIILENFALIKSGMNLSKLDIDFSKAKHTLTLIVGNNGTGKTAMMSNFHPFATLGNLENREDSDLIIPKEDGRKEIWYEKDSDIYHITHHYQYVGEKRSRKISSYIKKNDVELNPTGAVTQFNQIIELEFQIDVNFLKLLRLGPNVQNFVQLSSTDRKSFVTKLLEEVDIYMRDYKRAVERSKLLKNALKLAVTKQEKLHITDVSILRTSIEQKETLLQELRGQKERMIQAFYEYKGSLDIETLSAYNELHNALKDDIQRIQKDLLSIPAPKYEHTIEGKETPSARYNELLRKLHDDRANIVSQRATYLAKLDHELETEKTLQQKINGVEQSIELQEIESYIQKLTTEKSEYDSKYESNIPNCRKSDLTTYISQLDSIRSILLDTLELPINGLKFFKEYYIDNQITVEKIPKYIHKLQTELGTFMEKKALLQVATQPTKAMEYLMYIPADCTIYNTCPYYLTHNNDSIELETIETLDIDIENRNVAIDVFRRIQEVSRLFTIVDSSPIRKDGGLDGFIVSICNRNDSEFIDYSALQVYTEWVDDYERYLEVLDKLEVYTQRKDSITSTTYGESKDSLIESLSATLLVIVDYTEKIAECDGELDQIQYRIERTEDRITDFESFTQNQVATSQLQLELTTKRKELCELEELAEAKELYEQKAKEFRRDMVDIESRITRLDDEIFKGKRDIIEYNQLEEEISHIQERFDIVDMLKETLSSSKGIPLLYINSYFKSLQAVANQIIQSIYQSDFSLLDFIVNDKEFRIPYRTKGVEVKDIKYASQAESSIATLAISFAILEQFANQYNIILLDEVDGPMYKQNKEKFFAALEGLLDRLHSEQVFIITQSTMFNNYPVNLIITDPNYQHSDDSSYIIYNR